MDERTMQPEPDNAAREAALRSHLAGRDQPCPRCTYNLRGLRGTRCPECDLPLRLQLAGFRPLFGLWAIALTGPALVLGFNVLTAVGVVTADLVSRGVDIPLVWLAVLSGPPVLLAATAIAVVVILRHLFVCTLPLVQWLAVAACWSLPVVNFGWLWLLIG
jgi:hypothetical protein